VPSEHLGSHKLGDHMSWPRSRSRSSGKPGPVCSARGLRSALMAGYSTDWIGDTFDRQYCAICLHLGLDRAMNPRMANDLVKNLHASLQSMRAERDELSKKIAATEAFLAQMGAPTKRGPGRPPGSGVKRGPGRPKGTG